MNQKDKQRIKRLEIKSSILTHYGNGKLACVKCGFRDIRALSIDHIDGGGGEHRRVLKRGGLSFYKWLRDNNYPDGFQTLCMNCQMIKSYRQDVPMSNTSSVAKRVRLWVAIREQPFYIRDIMVGLGLPEGKRLSVRVELCRLKKAGIIKSGGREGMGYYKKCAKPVKVFRRNEFDYALS